MLDELKAKFAAAYHRGVNEVLTTEQDEALRLEFRELEDKLMGLMPEKEFQEYYAAVHASAWQSR